MNVYPEDFLDKFEVYTGTFLNSDIKGLCDMKSVLKDNGFLLRTKYYASLGATAVRAIRPKGNREASKEDLEIMKDWVKF